MRSLRFVLAAASLVATAAIASPAAPQNGQDFTTLAKPQPTSADARKIEVIEFFAYHCPACYVMEAPVAEWVKKSEGSVTFKRVALPFGGPTDPEARLWLTLDAMGLAETVGPKVFNAFHVQRVRLNKDETILNWIGTAGVDKAKFTAMWNSFGVLTKLKRLPAQVSQYQVNGTPTFVVDGRFVTSPSTVGEANKNIPGQQVPAATMTTLTSLVAMAQKDKGIVPGAAPAPAPAKAAAKK